MESNNDLKFVESLAAAMTYLTKYLTKSEPRCDIMLELKHKISEIHNYDPDDQRSELSKFISLAIKYNKKDVSLHQALWKLQDF